MAEGIAVECGHRRMGIFRGLIRNEASRISQVGLGFDLCCVVVADLPVVVGCRVASSFYRSVNVASGDAVEHVRRLNTPEVVFGDSEREANP